ncbi:hypothetical protein HJC23_008791 [Cyclotella cryptica]|uniref:ABM domain-containing protein n=1 Tax=Cyclotella cryptica TaxID=29204 RepID=A0ABD3PR19_9STRA|eukprot:CCRYP_012190-RA/>CCRYP_012190-RA protein AED:0.07 eAED:0.07 QI:164/1/1/1/1/1/3/163/337
MKNTATISVLLLLSSIHTALSFQTPASRSSAAPRLWSAPPAIEETSSSTNEGTEAKLLSRDRYVATNRFTVRPNSQAKFEKRWADRSSRLASLEGFRYFHLMRRVALENDVNSGIDPLANVDEFGNYVSFTIWQEKKHFNAWRAGDAFKEAHGGTSLFAFVTTMVSSAMVLKGAPKPAFYDGLLHQSIVPDSVPETVDGWRSVEADGKNILPAECFVACNQFFVTPSNAVEFEQRWADRTSKLKECEGFVSFDLLRRDVKAKGHGIAPMGEEEPTYMSCTIWKDRAAFNAWKNGNAFKEAHGEKKNVDEKSKMPLWSKPPVPVFYEGTLVISSPDGA